MIKELKKEFVVNSKCNDKNCAKCLLINCKDDNCPVGVMEKKKIFVCNKKIGSNFMKKFLILILFVLVISGCSIKQEKSLGDVRKNSISKNQQKTENQAKILSGEVLKFDSKDYKLYYIAPINNGLAMHYSADKLNLGTISELIINQYGNKISAKDLAGGIIKESEGRGAKLFSPFTAPDSQKREAHYIASREVDEYNENLATNYLMKVFEDSGSTYSIIYSQKIEGKDKKDMQNISEQWFLDNLIKYNGALEQVDLLNNISFYDKNKEILKSLSKSNKFQFLKWDNKVIKEENKNAGVVIEYPQFIGGTEISNLNELIKGIVDKILADDRSLVKSWLDNNTNGCSKDSKGYEYECSVLLAIRYEVSPIINDIVSIKMIFSDFTGGGNGNHDRVIIINYDLKNDQNLIVDSLFCNKDYISKLAPIVKADVYGQIETEYPDQIIEEEAIVSSNYENIGMGEFGINIYFQPYVLTSGSYGIVEAFIPYSDLVGDVCLP